MPTTPSKYAENQFDAATADSLPLMGEILDTTLPRITAAAILHAALVPAQTAIATAAANWSTGETLAANTLAAQMGATLALTDRMLSLTRKPDADTNSPLETWDTAIRGQVAFNGPTYLALLPHGRTTLTEGTIEGQLDALRDFGLRLTAQVTKPVLVTLGTTVTTWANAARGLRNDQTTKITAATNADNSMEDLRVAAAEELFGMVGLGMNVFKKTPLLVDTLFDVNVLRSPSLPVPTAPLTTTWTPLARRLSTTAMPANATRLEAWRLGPGAVAELIAVGVRGELEVTIPADITFDTGNVYQLWLQSRNGTGSSGPGPLQTWTA